MAENVINEMKTKMEKSFEALTNELRRLRTGRASLAILDTVKVDNYGSMVPLNHVANLSVPDPRTISIQPWDPSMIAPIEKAILTSGLDLTPSNDGKVIRIPIPPLTEERRKEIVKLVKKIGEDSKVAIRNIRRDFLERIKKMEKDKQLSEDDSKRKQKEIQDITDNYIKKVDSALALKEKEIMEV
jgi:ribosome recycling factor